MVQKAVTGNIQFIELKKKINPVLSQQTVCFNFVGRQDSQINRCTGSAAKAQLHRTLGTAQTGNEWGRRTIRTPPRSIYIAPYMANSMLCTKIFLILYGVIYEHKSHWLHQVFAVMNLIGHTKILLWQQLNGCSVPRPFSLCEGCGLQD